MSSAVVVPILSVLLAGIYLWYFFSEGSQSIAAAFKLPLTEEILSIPETPPSLAMQQDPFSLRSYAGFGLTLVPVLVGAMFLYFRMVRMCEEAPATRPRSKQ